jgi:hypothetical protein|tara:strand:- start:103 stop:426 length:324 start_codon:yes stop_codon:yes gene_type:complete
MARKTRKKNVIDPNANAMLEKYGEWKKGDKVWYTSYLDELKYGTIMYFSEIPESGKKWVTLWDLTNPRYESAPIETLSREAPDKVAHDKVFKLIARSKRRNSKKKGE